MTRSEIRKLTEGPTEAAPALVAAQPYSVSGSPGTRLATDVTVTPTQVRRPWRSTVRTIFQALVGLATLLPFILTDVYDSPDAYPAVVVQVLVVAGVITRLMANPRVEEFLRQFLPFLAAAPSAAKERGQGGVVLTEICLIVIAAGVVLFLLFGANWIAGPR